MGNQVEITYNGVSQGVITETQNIKLNTQNKYCAHDIGINIELDGGAPTPPETPTDSIIFYSLEPFSLLTVTKQKIWNGTMYYSTDHSNWEVWDGIETLFGVENNNYYILYIRGSNTKVSASNASLVLSGSSLIKCCGNLNRLLSYTSDLLDLSDSSYNAAFAYLFYQCGNVSFDVSLPATKLASSIYQYMFAECSSLTTAPALPATTLAQTCYGNMFRNCVSLVTPPSLPAMTIPAYAYSYMFSGCNSLLTAPALPATTLNGNYCYLYMFNNCSSLTTPPPSLPATTLTNGCYTYMFYGCRSLTSAPTILATTVGDSSCRYMFQYCTSLQASPALGATTLGTYCYAYMFYGCSSLTSLPALPATTLPNYCYQYMFSVCSNIKVSSSQTGEYVNAYRLPSSGTGSTGSNSMQYMFTNTGGTFIGTPIVNTTYYTSNTVVSAT